MTPLTELHALAEKASRCAKATQDEDDGSWDTSCGEKHVFTADGPEENSHKFCPYCGDALSTYRSKDKGTEGCR